jgi:hypothetical protein
MEGENAKTGRDPHHSRQSQHRASPESQMGRSKLTTDNQRILSNVHVDPGAAGGFRNSARRHLNATPAEERQGQTESRRPPQTAMLVDTDTAEQPPERTSLQPTAEDSDPQHLESSTGSLTPNYDRSVLSLIETLRSKVERFVTGSFDLPSEVDRSQARARIYRPVIDLVQDKEANSNPKACMCPFEPSQSLALRLTLKINRHGGCKENKRRPRRPSQTL